VLDHMGQSPEDHRRQFRGLRLGPGDRPLTFAHQLRDAGVRWMRPGESEGERRMMDAMVLEQLLEGLPTRTSSWVRCHRPGTVDEAITLAEDHLAVYPPAKAAAPVDTLPTPAPRRRFEAPEAVPPSFNTRSLSLPLPLPLFLSLPLSRVQRRAFLPAHSGSLKRLGRTAGGVGSPDTAGGSVPSWRSDR